MIMGSLGEYKIEAILSESDILYAIEDLKRYDSFIALQKLVVKHSLDKTGRRIKSHLFSKITREMILRYIFEVQISEEKIDTSASDDFDDVVAIFWASLERKIALKEIQEQQIAFSVDELNLKLDQDDYQLISEKLREEIKASLSFAQQASYALKGVEKVITALNDAVARKISFASRYEKINWEETKKSFYQWAQYGWTIAWNAPPGLYMTFPSSQQVANSMALEYVDDKYLAKLFVELRAQFNFNQDFEAALFCFESKQFKLCSIMLCTLIDRTLILFDKNVEKKTGAKAVNKIVKEGNYDLGKISSDIRYLFAYNTFVFLNSLFKAAENFELQSEWVNRNLLAHGMYNNEVTAVDCMKLFLGLFNTRKLLNKINQQK